MPPIPQQSQRPRTLLCNKMQCEGARLRIRGIAAAVVLVLFSLVPARAADQWHDPAPHDQCEMCHNEHFSQSHTWSGVGSVGNTAEPDGDWLGNGPNARLLRAPADEMCTACHNGAPPVATPVVAAGSGARVSTTTAPSPVRPHSFNSIVEWTRSAHGNMPPAVKGSAGWRGGGRCVDCHDPHGVRDAKGLIPASLRAREPELCLVCHDNPQSGDIVAQTTRAWSHGAQSRGSHDPFEGSDPARFGASPEDHRHVSCSDCHNSHEGNQDPAPSSPAEASTRLAGVSRVEAVSGGAGVVPTYRFHTADEADRTAEYEVCFKCHSSWTRQPSGQSDLARLTDPANASFHPIQAEGKNRNIPPEAFVGGYSPASRIACSDCHSSDDPDVRGPHGSSYPYLLKKPTTSGLLAAPITSADLCFDCHSYRVYGDGTSSPELQAASRFNGPSTAGHAFHVGVERIPCYSCHETHGSVRNASLIAMRPMGGITSYSQTLVGGSCGSTCHGNRSWAVNYRR